MNTSPRNKICNILCWNIRGINSENKWLAIAHKIEESACAIICLQETKREHFDHSYLRKFCPRRFDRFCFQPSQGASGGLIVICSSTFNGTLISCSPFEITIQFCSTASSSDVWFLTNIYSPCSGDLRNNFTQWLNGIDFQPDANWILMGDFNFIRSAENRNLPGGDMNDIMIFNDIISNVGLQELPLKGRSYTWSNMQDQPLLQQLDWFFTSLAWTLAYPNIMVTALSKYIADQAPCVVSIETSTPKSHIFRFENYWADLPSFLDVVQTYWNLPIRATHQGVIINAMFKNVRRGLKQWSKRLSNLNTLIANSTEAVDTLDKIEEQRPLFIQEWNFRKIVKEHILKLLQYKHSFWKKKMYNQMGKIRR